MNATFAILMETAELPGDFVASLLRMVGNSTGLFADESPGGSLGVLMSVLSGIATALAVAIMLTVYFRSGHRSARDVIKYGLATVLFLALVAFVAYDTRHATLAYLGINPAKPAIEFEIRLPKTVLSAAADSQVELHTDRNQTLARMQGVLASDDDGRSVLRGSVRLDYRTKDRVLILTLPGQAQCEFKLRLAANPSHSDEYGPWHLADRVAAADKGDETRSQQNDAFAIRYRVI
jgi:hypothetical protein